MLGACGSSSKPSPDGAAGTTGTAGTDGGAGTTGTAGADGGAGTTGTAGTGADAGNATYSLSFMPAKPSFPAGGTRTVNVSITRNGFTGTIAFTAEGAPAGLTSTFRPASSDGDGTSLELDAADTVAPGTYQLTIKGTSGSQTAVAALPVVITGPATLLLVDHDDSDNNGGVTNPNASPSDTLFDAYISGKGISYNTFVVSHTDYKGPTADSMKKYDTVVWYTGEQYGGDNNNATISSSDELQLQAWLDMGGKRLIIFSPEYVYGLSNVDWTSSDASNTFFNSYLGGVGGHEADNLNNKLATVTGVGASALTLTIQKDDPIKSFFNIVNPAAGTDTLFTVSYDPTDSGTASATAVATGRKLVGTAKTSKVVYVGFPVENILVTDKTNDVQAKAIDAVFAY